MIELFVLLASVFFIADSQKEEDAVVVKPAEKIEQRIEQTPVLILDETPEIVAEPKVTKRISGFVIQDLSGR